MRRLTPAELEEERRLLAAAQRDPARFAEVYERYVDAIHSFAYHQTGSASRAEEVTAETFERALKHLPRFRWRGVPYAALLYRIAASIVAQDRRRPLLTELPAHAPSSAPDPEAAWMEFEAGARLRSALADLPPDQRLVLVLRFEAGMRNHEIATTIGRSEGAVKALTFRAISTLRRTLDPEEVRS
jgi:RNA polymerase sigma-70 factor (ECF subfamily)